MWVAEGEGGKVGRGGEEGQFLDIIVVFDRSRLRSREGVEVMAPEFATWNKKTRWTPAMYYCRKSIYGEVNNMAVGISQGLWQRNSAKGDLQG